VVSGAGAQAFAALPDWVAPVAAPSRAGERRTGMPSRGAQRDRRLERQAKGALRLAQPRRSVVHELDCGAPSRNTADPAELEHSAESPRWMGASSLARQAPRGGSNKLDRDRSR
jgi:hypothetical protein